MVATSCGKSFCNRQPRTSDETGPRRPGVEAGFEFAGDALFLACAHRHRCIRRFVNDIDADPPAPRFEKLRFLAADRQIGSYLLMPAICDGSGPPAFRYDLSITKRALSVRDAIDITNDIESVHLKGLRS